MDAPRRGERAAPEAGCPRGCRWTSRTREPGRRLCRRTFGFHFRNLLFASGRNATFLCYRVEGGRDPAVLHVGVFGKETHLHAELCFLSWVHDTLLVPDSRVSPEAHYRVTWYISWSPCWDCAKQVAEFLANHRNVALTVFCARLYYFWEPEYRAGLRALHKQGADLRVMSFPEFWYCWKNFVYNNGDFFYPWSQLHQNSRDLSRELEDVLRSTMNLLKEDKFRIQFNNAHKVPEPYRHRRRVTYLCYRLQVVNGPTLDTRCLRTKKGRHAERRFIGRLRSMNLNKGWDYQVTCYLTWSPCRRCAQELAGLKRDYPRLHLSIFACRLYFHWLRSYQEGLVHLWQSQVPVAIMGLSEFVDCWDTFVEHQPGGFEPWERLENYSDRTRRRLQRILKSWDVAVDDLMDNFRNLQLGPASPSAA